MVPKEGREPAKQKMLSAFGGRAATEWMPDDIAFLDEIPHISTGKIQKTTLGRQFWNYTLQTA